MQLKKKIKNLPWTNGNLFTKINQQGYLVEIDCPVFVCYKIKNKIKNWVKIQLVILYILWEISWISLSVLNVWLLKYSLFTLLLLTWPKAYLCQQRSAEISTIIINIIMDVNIKSFAFISKWMKHFITNSQ